MTVGREFSNSNHLRTQSEERRDGKEARYVAYKSRLKGLVKNLKVADKRLLLRSKRTGAWLSVCGTTMSGTVLSATEFLIFKCAHYNVSPVNLQSHGDGCGTAFGVTHTLSCSIGGLVIARQNEILDELL